MDRIKVKTIHEVEFLNERGVREIAPPKATISVDIDTAAELERAGAAKSLAPKVVASAAASEPTPIPRFRRKGR